MKEESKFNEIPVKYLPFNPDFYTQVKLVADRLDIMIASSDNASFFVLIGKTGQSYESRDVGQSEFAVIFHFIQCSLC